jgi:hypothetical protein
MTTLQEIIKYVNFKLDELEKKPHDVFDKGQFHAFNQLLPRLESLLSEQGNEDLGQIFKDNSDCYADCVGDVVQGMTEKRFIEVVTKLQSTTQRDEEKKNEPTEEKGVIIMEFFPM